LARGPLVAAALACGATTCGTTSSQHLDSAALHASQPARLLLVLDPNDSFGGAISPTHKMFHYYGPGLLGAAANLAAISEAEHAFAAENDLEDPALELGRRLAADLAVDYGLSLSTLSRPPREQPTKRSQASSSFETGADLARGQNAADLVLELRTTTWELESGPAYPTIVSPHASGQAPPPPPPFPQRVGLRYVVEVTLTDVRTKRTWARGTCEDRDPRIVSALKARSRAEAEPLVAPAHTYHDMVTLSARLIAEELGRARQRCERMLRAEVLALQPPPPEPVAAPRRPVAPPPAADGGAPPMVDGATPESPAPVPASPVPQRKDDETP
jgi:hypothetical protein